MAYLGNNTVVARQYNDSRPPVLQRTYYHPYGKPIENWASWGGEKQPYKFGGKEREEMFRLGTYDFTARTLDEYGRFTTIDPLAENYYSTSPYAYVLNNPVNSIDPDGRSTWVKSKDDGTYEVFDGSLEDDDLNIYVYTKDENGEYTVKGESIGATTSITSFYDSYATKDGGAWAEGSIINPNDKSGDTFLQGLLTDEPSLVGYMTNATEGKKYDFKRTNNTNKIKYTKSIGWYRGMPLTNPEFVNDDMAPVYTSAKDIGNMAAGYMAAIKGLTWKQARWGFDLLQKLQEKNINAVELPSTQNAQRYGFRWGERRLIINNFTK